MATTIFIFRSQDGTFRSVFLLLCFSFYMSANKRKIWIWQGSFSDTEGQPHKRERGRGERDRTFFDFFSVQRRARQRRNFCVSKYHVRKFSSPNLLKKVKNYKVLLSLPLPKVQNAFGITLVSSIHSLEFVKKKKGNAKSSLRLPPIQDQITQKPNDKNCGTRTTRKFFALAYLASVKSTIHFDCDSKSCRHCEIA